LAGKESGTAGAIEATRYAAAIDALEQPTVGNLQ
jgi:hypothetical protein